MARSPRPAHPVRRMLALGFVLVVLQLVVVQAASAAYTLVPQQANGNRYNPCLMPDGVSYEATSLGQDDYWLSPTNQPLKTASDYQYSWDGTVWQTLPSYGFIPLSEMNAKIAQYGVATWLYHTSFMPVPSDATWIYMRPTNPLAKNANNMKRYPVGRNPIGAFANVCDYSIDASAIVTVNDQESLADNRFAVPISSEFRRWPGDWFYVVRKDGSFAPLVSNQSYSPADFGYSDADVAADGTFTLRAAIVQRTAGYVNQLADALHHAVFHTYHANFRVKLPEPGEGETTNPPTNPPEVGVGTPNAPVSDVSPSATPERAGRWRRGAADVPHERADRSLQPDRAG